MVGFSSQSFVCALEGFTHDVNTENEYSRRAPDPAAMAMPSA